jgi:hypothetical protein
MARRHSHSPWYSHALALAGYTLLTLVMTAPLALRLSTHLAGSGDDMWLFQWSNWWLRKALQEGLNPYFTTYLFHPQGASLVYHNFSWLNTGTWLVLEPLMGAIAAYNVTFLLTFILSGYATFALVSYLTHSRSAAFVAGLIFAFAPYHLSQFNHPNLISVQWLPFCMLFLIRIVREGGRWRDVGLCILALVFTGLSRWQLLIFAAVLMTLYLAYSLLFERDVWSRRTVLAIAAVGLGTALCISPLAVPLAAGLADQDVADEILTEQQDWAQTDLLAYVIPNRYHPLFGSQLMPIYDRFRKNRGHIAFLGYTTLLLAGYGMLRARRATRYWALAAMSLMLLALGPVLRFNGQLYPSVPMPHHLVGWLPPIKALRNADRFNVALSLPLAVLAGYGVASLQQDLKRRLSMDRQDGATSNGGVELWECERSAPKLVVVTLTLGVAGLILFEFLSIPFPTVRPLTAPFYQDLAQETGDFAILEVPIGRGYSKAYMYLQTVHGKHLVEGHISRTPPGAYAFIESNPFLGPLSETGDLDTDSCDLSRHLSSLAEEGIRYIVIHKRDLSAEQIAAWREHLTTAPRYEDDALLVYPTQPILGEDFDVALELGGGLALIQATVAPTQTVQGNVVSIDLRWTATDVPQGDYTARLTLIDPNGEVVQESTERICREWPTSEWSPGSIVVDPRGLQIAPFLAPSTYQLMLSVVEPKTGEVLVPAQPLGTLDVTALERHFAAPQVGHTSTATFGQALDLLGYDLRQEDDTLHLTLHWQARQRLPYYKFFVHLYDPHTGDLVAQHDGVPRAWTYPSNWWEAGEVVSDSIVLPLEGVPAGDYRLRIGVYDPETLKRLPAESEDASAVGDHLDLGTTIHVP